MAVPFALPMHLFPPAFTRGRISEIGFEIAALKASISKLKLERKILEKHLARYIYPVLTLPNEIISEIFLQSLDISDSSLSGPASPLFLGHICQKWRDIALSTPSLWTSISLTITNNAAPDRRLRLLETWLARSRACPLSISITDNSRQYNGASFTHRFVDAIVPHHRRWQVLRLQMAYSDLPQVEGELSLLRELEISVNHCWTPNRSLRKFLRAPKLQTVTQNGIYRRLALFPLPWKQLTTLSVSQGTSLEHVVQILRITSNLTYFAAQLACYSWERGEMEMVDIPSIPPLIHLRILDLYPKSNTTRTLQRQLLDLLTLPALNYLNISEPLVSTVVRLINRSRCPFNALYFISVGQTAYCASLSSRGKIVLEACMDETDGSSEED
ncbi:hypothetical protein B0H13DRAFT_2035750 [Mycena leptocephala]|nr:hypothetical protein B0H13DRAFT_2035750 [Mycena leptocephala]